MTAAVLVRPTRRLLSTGWSLLRTEPGACADPGGLATYQTDGEFDLEDVTVPCTVASAMRAAGRLDLESRVSIEALGDLDHFDHWFRLRFPAEPGDTTLVFEGLATLAEVWLNGERLLETENMFRTYRIPVGERLGPDNELALCFRGLEDFLARKRPRARWRTALVAERNLRFLRTTLCGRMPSHTPPIAPVGPWGQVALETRPDEAVVLERVRLRPRIVGGGGRVEVEASLQRGAGVARADDEAFWLEIEGEGTRLGLTEDELGRVTLRGEATMARVERWWPQSHLAPGQCPRRYAVSLVRTQGTIRDEVELEPVAFRSIARRASARFALQLNGEPIFCRGTCWTPLDPLALRSDEGELRRALEQALDAGINMLRIAGTGVYEQEALYRLCDELGILVWQDFMFATFDYPTEDDLFRVNVEAEVDDFLDRVEGRACLAVLCGSSEGQQQPAMLGLAESERASSFFDSWLPARCAERRPDVPYWPSTPSGGELPFHTNVGTTHYFGVGGYRRPLDDVRLARPAFATECLAFANLPGTIGPDPSRADRVPRDRGADWDFLDVTRHYRDLLFGPCGRGSESEGIAVDRAEESAELRATSSSVMETTQAWLRDAAADCGGALVLMHRDPWSCAGWGVIAADRRPKSAWYGLARAWAPLAVAILDDGLNGLRVRIQNDRPSVVSGMLEVCLVRLDGTVIESQSRPLRVPPRRAFVTSVDRWLGGFVDSSYAYRFGPPGFDVAVARFRPDGGECEHDGAWDPVGLEAVHLPVARGRLPAEELGLRARWCDGWQGAEPATRVLVIETDRFAQTVAIDGGLGVPGDNFFHLVPGHPRRVVLRSDADGGANAGPLRVRALNGMETVELGLEEHPG